MKRTTPPSATPKPAARIEPSAESAALALREGAVLMTPVVEWLLRHGVAYPAFVEMLKGVFVDVARSELQRGDTPATQSALSVLSGVHRKDVRTLMDVDAVPRGVPRPPLSSQVYTRWLSDRRFRAADGRPRKLPRSGEGRTFESLCRELSSDVHPRAVLDELLRLGHVALEGDDVVAASGAFVPAPQLEAMTALFSANAADHLAAAVSNITLEGPRFLEQSIYADGLRPESIASLHDVARAAWAQAFDAVVNHARDRVDADMTSDGDQRMRFGVYFYNTAVPSAEAPANTAKGKKRAPSAATRPKARRRTL